MSALQCKPRHEDRGKPPCPFDWRHNPGFGPFTGW